MEVTGASGQSGTQFLLLSGHSICSLSAPIRVDADSPTPAAVSPGSSLHLGRLHPFPLSQTCTCFSSPVNPRYQPSSLFWAIVWPPHCCSCFSPFPAKSHLPRSTEHACRQLTNGFPLRSGCVLTPLAQSSRCCMAHPCPLPTPPPQPLLLSFHFSSTESLFLF